MIGDRKDTLLRLQHFFSQKLYRDVKFICDQSELDANSEEGTIGFFVLNGMRVPFNKQGPLWSTYKNDVLNFFNSQ